MVYQVCKLNINKQKVLLLKSRNFLWIWQIDQYIVLLNEEKEKAHLALQ